ncbi:ATP synthase subunit C [Methylosarcina fibrata]|jgi:V/A-type H+-transporting ATPase subunit K|uniref:ATP synthase subunit C n=1 Tax=Methylosarcina fibrata TaxID=105972 RepID=UPI0003789DD0|nr:ATP synthase subunit C [Methylosarcina fibrata]
MTELMMILGWTGLYAPMVLGAVGSIVGCSIAGQAAIGAMLDSDSGYGRFVGVSAMPSSQTIYGIVVMLTLNRPITPEAALGIFVIGLMSGIALMLSAIYQGQCCASAIYAAKSKPEIFGLAVAPAAFVEGFAVFTFIFALVISAGIPKP